MVPDSARIGFAAAITLLFLPFLMSVTPGTVKLDLAFLILMIKEVFVGVLIAFLISIPFFIAQSAGSIIDHQRGAQSLQVTNPNSSSPTSPMGTLFSDLMTVIFYALGGVLFFFEAFFSSYHIIPPNKFLSPKFFTLDHLIWVSMIDMANLVLKLVLQLSAPALLIILLSDVFLGVANRMAPQVQVTFLLYSLKSFMGIAIVWLGWWLLLRQLDIELLTWFKTFTRLIQSFAPL